MELATALTISARGLDAHPERLRALALRLGARPAAPRRRVPAMARPEQPRMASPEVNCAANLGTLASIRAMLARTLEMLQ